MPRRVARLAFLALLLVPALGLALVGAAGCGIAGAQNRPEVVATLPVAGTTVDGPLASLRLEFDEPVTLFATYQIQVVRDGVGVAASVFQLPGEPTIVRVRSAGSAAFEEGAYRVSVLEGLVLNAEQHYTLEPFTFEFEVDGGALSLFTVVPGTLSVTELDPVSLAVRSQTFAPIAQQVPQAVAAVKHGAVTRVLVQMADDGGTGAALGAYEAGDAVWLPVSLTHGGSGLLGGRPCLLVGPGGEEAYLVFRDVAAQQTRLARVRTIDGVETGSLLLSPAADPECLPTAIELIEGGTQLLVLVQRAGTAHVCRVALATLTEVDFDGGTPGVQAWQPGAAAGPADILGDLLVVAPDGPTTADLEFFNLTNSTRTPDVSTIPGSTTCVRATLDARHVLAGLALGTPDEHLTARPTSALLEEEAFAISDDVGGADQGTTRVHDMLAGALSTWVLLDQDVLLRLVSTPVGLAQVDEDPLTDGVQARTLPAGASGARRLGRVEAVIP
jgi:hypothetical protein